MGRLIRGLAGIVLAGGALGCTTDVSFDVGQGGLDLFVGQRTAEDFVWRGRVAEGRGVEIKGVNGDVEAEHAAGDGVEVTVTRSGRRNDPNEVKIEVVEHAGGVTICAVYPTPGGDAPNECRPGDEGRMKVRNNDVKVEFRVRVPARVRFAGRTVNGSVSVRDLAGDVRVRTVNGSVRIATAGHAEARTVNGSITASMGRADWTGPVAFETVNGTITLDLPSDTNAELRASTTNGTITSELPLTVQGEVSRRRLRGVIGTGGRELRLETVNGSIRLRRAS